MICPACESENVSVQITTETEMRDEDNHGTLWTVLLVLWCIVVLIVYTGWFLLAIPALLFIVSGQKKQTITQKHIAVCVCQDCGHAHRVHTIIPDEQSK